MHPAAEVTLNMIHVAMEKQCYLYSTVHVLAKSMQMVNMDIIVFI